MRARAASPAIFRPSFRAADTHMAVGVVGWYGLCGRTPLRPGAFSARRFAVSTASRRMSRICSLALCSVTLGSGRFDDRVAMLALSDSVPASLLAFPTQRASTETPFFSTLKAF